MSMFVPGAALEDLAPNSSRHPVDVLSFRMKSRCMMFYNDAVPIIVKKDRLLIIRQISRWAMMLTEPPQAFKMLLDCFQDNPKTLIPEYLQKPVRPLDPSFHLLSPSYPIYLVPLPQPPLSPWT